MTIFYSASNNGFYDTGVHAGLFSENGEPIGIISGAVSISAEEHSRLITASSTGKLIKAGEDGRPIAVEPEITDETKWWRVREERNLKLAETDYTQMPDYSINNKDGWIKYRQALRDITTSFNSPTEVIWPTLPI